MKTSSKRDKSAGFAVVETLLVLIILAAIVGVGAYVVRQKHNANSTLSGNGGSIATKAPAGTATSVDQLTRQDAQIESGADSSSDNNVQQASTSANGAAGNVGGAYNETNL